MGFVLIPGAGGSAWYWHLLEPELRKRGHEVVAVSLPAADERAGLREYADAVARAAGGLDGAGLVVVAQSLAGFVAPLVCERMAVTLLVLLNAMIPNPGETPGEWWGNTRHAEAKRSAFDPRADFFHDVPRRVVAEAFAQGEPRQSERPFGTRCAFKAWPGVPTRVLVGRDDRFFPAAFQRRVARERLGVKPDEMPGGHLVALSRPQELARRLHAYAAKLSLEGALT